MNRLSFALALLGAPGLVVVGLMTSSQLVPDLLAPGLAGLGGLLAIAGAASARVRVHGAGVLVAIVGASLTGVGLGTLEIVIGVASATLLVASLNFHLSLPEDTSGFSLVLTALASAGLVAALALGIASLSGWLATGGVDAAGVAAWLVLLAAVTWGLVRHTREEPA